jgi:hypothetical protein
MKYCSERIRARLVRGILQEIGLPVSKAAQVRKALEYIGAANFKRGGFFREEALQDIKQVLRIEEIYGPLKA